MFSSFITRVRFVCGKHGGLKILSVICLFKKKTVLNFLNWFIYIGWLLLPIRPTWRPAIRSFRAKFAPNNFIAEIRKERRSCPSFFTATQPSQDRLDTIIIWKIKYQKLLDKKEIHKLSFWLHLQTQDYFCVWEILNFMFLQVSENMKLWNIKWKRE